MVSTTIQEMIRRASTTLQKAGVDTPVNDAKLLMAHVYGVGLCELETMMLLGKIPAEAPNPLSPQAEANEDAPGVEAASTQTVDAADRYRAFVQRRARREPLQHIVGHAPFRYLDVRVGPGVFIPRPETETVVQTAIDWLECHGMNSHRVVDLCSGSGAVGLSLVTELRGCELWAVESSSQAVTWARRNMKAVFTKDISAGYNYHMIQGDATSESTLHGLDGSIDLVISNPPYVPQTNIPKQPEVRDHDPALALYGGSGDGTRTPKQIIVRSAALLHQGGALVMEHDISQADILTSFALEHGFASAASGLDLTGRPRCLIAERN